MPRRPTRRLCRHARHRAGGGPAERRSMRQRLNSIRAYIADLNSSDPSVSEDAEISLLDALQRLRRSRPEAADLLIAATAHPNPTVRFRAVWALASTRLKQAYSAIVALVDDPDGAVRYDAVMALGRFG